MDLRTFLVITHIIGTALGVGAATVSDYLFFKFARDGKLDKDEFRILQTVSEIIWIGLFIILLSGFGFVLLHIADYDTIRATYNLDKVWAKVTIVLILLGNGFVLHRRVLPLFASRLGKSFATHQFIKKSTIIFTAGAVSATSWYTALVLGGWRSLQANYTTIMIVYALLLGIAIITANIVGKHLLHQLRRHLSREQ